VDSGCIFALRIAEYNSDMEWILLPLILLTLYHNRRSVKLYRWLKGGDWYLIDSKDVGRRWSQDSPGLFDTPYDRVLKEEHYRV
jgi:hypothetical protein